MMKKVFWKVWLIVLPVGVAAVSALFVIWFAYSYVAWQRIENNGAIAQARVTDHRIEVTSIRQISPENNHVLSYEFEVDDTTYTSDITGFGTPGDTFDVRYAKDDPNIHALASVDVGTQKLFYAAAAISSSLLGIGAVVITAMIVRRKVKALEDPRKKAI